MGILWFLLLSMFIRGDIADLISHSQIGSAFFFFFFEMELTYDLILLSGIQYNDSVFVCVVK